ncbi:MAG: crossover junction endodeoxyribonuclease RuvC [Proteobacteria bacterium]|nr:crossover junction endodeoxyribonuclease RuvC [Pseudomonadota bacterium]
MTIRLIGFDPGLRNTGWGVIETQGNRLSHVGDGIVTTDAALPLADRLVQLHDGLVGIIEQFHPDEAAVEETFVNKNAASTLKLGQARAISLLVPALGGLKVFEYSPNLIKKTVVGGGHAAKQQIQMMVKTLLPGAELKSADAADALAVAICHAHHRDSVQTRAALATAAAAGGAVR